MATMILGMTYARNAGANLTDKLFYLAKVDTDGDLVLAAAATDSVLGVITEDGAADTPVTVQIDGIGKVIAGGSITAGARLTSDGNAKAVGTTSAGNQVFGIALESANTNEIVKFAFARGHVAAT